MSFDWAAYRAGLSQSADAAEWNDAADLSRLSIDAFRAELNPLRRDLSNGFLRLTGDGVVGHSAPVEEVANVMRHFQRLVLATGLSMSGFKSLRGALPVDVVSRTRLQLSGSAIPGSLVLQLVPATLPADEVMVDGQAELFGAGEAQLVDRAVENAVALLNASKEADADADQSAFIKALTEAGPRVATTIRDFARTLVEANFAPDIASMQPRRPQLRSRLSVAQLTYLGQLVANRELAKEPVTIKGTLHTVSDISAWKVETADGDNITVQAKNIPKDEIGRLRVGMVVEITADVTEKLGPSGDSESTYSATSVDIVQEPIED